MRWRDKQQEIDDCEIVIYYNDSYLYPISEWLHPGALPIGTGLKDDIRQDLPNLDWPIRHLIWMGFNKITIVSHEEFKGLDLFYRNFEEDVKLNFTTKHFSEVLKSLITNDVQHIIFLSGLKITNSDLRHSYILHKQRSNFISMLSIRGLKFRIGVAEVDESQHYISNFKEKPTDRDLLINSNIIILDTFRVSKKSDIYRDYMNRIDGHGFSVEKIISETMDFVVENEILSSVELTGVADDPWFIDLSLLETWVKLDHDEFIDNFSHLYTKA